MGFIRKDTPLKVSLFSTPLKPSPAVAGRPIRFALFTAPPVLPDTVRFTGRRHTPEQKAAKLLLNNLPKLAPVLVDMLENEDPRVWPLLKDTPSKASLFEHMRQLNTAVPAEAIRDPEIDSGAATVFDFWKTVKGKHPNPGVRAKHFNTRWNIGPEIPYAQVFYGTPVLESTPLEILHKPTSLDSLKVKGLHLYAVTNKDLTSLLEAIPKNPALKRWFKGLHYLKIMYGPESYTADYDRTAYILGIKKLLSHCPHLTHLDLSNDFATNWGLTNLAAEHLKILAPGFADLRYLKLGLHDLGESGLVALGQMPELAKLNYLGLADNGLNAKALGWLGRSPYLTRLTHLDLTNNPLGVSWSEENASNKTMNAAFQEFINTPNLPELTHLNLSNTHLNDDQILALAQAPNRRNLKYLKLKGNYITDHGFIALALSPLKNLKYLDVRNNLDGNFTITPLFLSTQKTLETAYPKTQILIGESQAAFLNVAI